MTSLTYDEAAEVCAVRTERHGKAEPAEAPVAGCVRRQQCKQQVRGRRQHHDGKATESVAKQMHIKVEVILRRQMLGATICFHYQLAPFFVIAPVGSDAGQRRAEQHAQQEDG